MSSTSISLLDRLRRPGEEAAWREFAQLYTPMILAWARGQGLAVGDAEELAQDVLAALVEQMPAFRYDPRQSFRGWLRTVTTNRCRDYFRRRRLRPQAGPEQAGRVEAADGLAGLGEQEYLEHLASRALDLMQSHFEPATWRACWECVVEGRSADEVAAELGISVNAVYLAKSRVLRRLRRELRGLLD